MSLAPALAPKFPGAEKEKIAEDEDTGVGESRHQVAEDCTYPVQVAVDAVHALQFVFGLPADERKSPAIYHGVGVAFMESVRHSTCPSANDSNVNQKEWVVLVFVYLFQPPYSTPMPCSL